MLYQAYKKYNRDEDAKIIEEENKLLSEANNLEDDKPENYLVS